MQFLNLPIEYWAIAAFIIWLIIAIAFIVICVRSDNKTKKAFENVHRKNIKATLLVPDDIPEEELGILCSEQPFVYLPEETFKFLLYGYRNPWDTGCSRSDKRRSS